MTDRVMTMRVVPHHMDYLPYPEEFHYSVELDEQEYSAEDLGNAMVIALELAHKHPQGPGWFHHFVITFEQGLTK